MRRQRENSAREIWKFIEAAKRDGLALMGYVVAEDDDTGEGTSSEEEE